MKTGDKVSEGSIILSLTTGEAPLQADHPSRVAACVLAGHRRWTAVVGAFDEEGFALAYAGPAVRKLARELGVDLGKVKGSGNHGRILREDVEALAKAERRRPSRKRRPQAEAASAASTFCPGPRSILRSTGRSSARSSAASRRFPRPIFTATGSSSRMSRPMTRPISPISNSSGSQMNKELEKSGVKLSLLPFMVKAAVATLKKFPEFNASLDGDTLVYKNYWHIGFAADTPNGLMVPVIRDADKKSVPEIAKEMNELAKARARRQDQARPDAGRDFLDLVARRNWRHLLHADHQRARSRDHGRVQGLLEAAFA